MKYIFVTGFLLLLTSLFSINAFAAEDRQPKTVSGKVRNPDSTVAKNIQVSVRCGGVTYTATTSVNGNYSVLFGNLECEQFDTAEVTIDTGSLSGNASKVVTFAQTVTMADITLQEATSTPTPTNTPVPETTSTISPSPEITPELTPTTEPAPTSVPEFGLVTGIMASSLSVLTYAKLRLWKSRS